MKKMDFIHNSIKEHEITKNNKKWEMWEDLKKEKAGILRKFL